jgi:predicted sulfurtransferase
MINLTVLAYFQNNFNDAQFIWLDETHCKITLTDKSSNKTGSFIAEYKDKVIINITEETGFNDISVSASEIVKPDFTKIPVKQTAEPVTVETTVDPSAESLITPRVI